MSKRRARGTGTLFFSSRRGVWVGRVKVGGRTVERSHRNQAELIRLLELAAPPGDVTTVAQWCARWLDGQHVRTRTLQIRENAVANHIAPVLGRIRVRDLTPHHVEQAARKWVSATSSNTARLTLSVLHTALQAAARAGLRPDNPVKLAAKPKGEKKRIDPFSPEQLAAIITEAGKKPAARILALLASTGCRIGEALALDVKDFDTLTGMVRITRTLALDGTLGPPKSANSVRTIRVPRPALAALRDAAGGRKAGPLFPRRDGKRQTHEGARWQWEGVLQRLGFAYRNPHQLRHSCGSHMVAAGKPVADVAKYLGDSPATIIATYTHATGADVAEAMDKALRWRTGGRRKATD